MNINCLIEFFQFQKQKGVIVQAGNKLINYVNISIRFYVHKLQSFVQEHLSQFVIFEIDLIKKKRIDFVLAKNFVIH